MEVITFDLDSPISLPYKISACIGYFDGLHLGHQQLIQHVRNYAKLNHTKTALITFDPDPWAVIKKMEHIPHLTPMDERIQIGETLGIEVWIILKFNNQMQTLSKEQFHDLVLKPLNIDTLVCGFDFHYGFKGEGDVTSLKLQNYFAVDVVDVVSSEQEKISSTRIEQCLAHGDVGSACKYLGRYYEVGGEVIYGKQRGREFGFPTANISLTKNYVVPKVGVYAGYVKVKNQWHCAIINIGHNPTYNYTKNLSIEAHILDFDDQIYGEQIRVRFVYYMRDEKKFDDAYCLKKQLEHDAQSAKNALATIVMK